MSNVRPTSKGLFMLLGVSSVADFVICVGLGVAAGCCLISTIIVKQIYTARITSLSINIVLRILTFIVFGGGLFAIAAVLGGTKEIRDANSTFGFVLGVVLIEPIVWLVLKREAGLTHHSSGTG